MRVTKLIKCPNDPTRSWGVPVRMRIIIIGLTSVNRRVTSWCELGGWERGFLLLEAEPGKQKAKQNTAVKKEKRPLMMLIKRWVSNKCAVDRKRGSN